MNVAYNKKILEIRIDVNIEISEVDHYMWVFTSTIFKLALEITFLFNKYILLSKNRKLNKRAGPIKGREWLLLNGRKTKSFNALECQEKIIFLK